MLHGHYHTALVLTSILVAILASYTALMLVGRVSNSQRSTAPWWIAGGAFAMGTGIWSMHFIGMLAFRLPVPLGYDLGITLLSWLLPIAVSAWALWQVSQLQINPKRLVGSGVLLGVGINAMHYVGMAAMRMQPGIVYDWGMVALSLVIAVGAATLSLWIAFRLRHNTPQTWWHRGVASTVMGAAIAGMHYTGMAAAHFPVDSIAHAANGAFGPDLLAILVILATFGVLTVALLTSIYDARLEARSHILALSQATSEERRQLLDRERAARADLERMSAMKDQFLATVSHELRTPLNAIVGWTQLLQLKSHDEKARQHALQTIERNAWIQARLIDDLLDMSRIVSGNIRLEMQTVEPVAFIEAAIETARPAAIAKRIELVVALDRDTGPIWGDPSRLQQVMWNLISNAVKFTPQDGRVHIELTNAVQGHIEIRVSDSGIGIGPDFLPHVFDRFRQADASTTRRHGGLGLGLSIAKQLIELHGGQIQASSEGEGKGAAFTMHMPLAVGVALRTPSEGPTTAVGRFASALFVPADLTGVTALVVDDEADARQLLHCMLSDCGAQVCLAGNAQAALSYLRQHIPDVLISDIGMPDMDGFELMRHLRAHRDARIAALPAIALTAFTRSEDERRALQAGFATYLSKPVDASMLVSHVAALAKQQASAA